MARGTSWLAQETLAMRVTPAGTSVEPKACLTVIVSPPLGPEEPESALPQAAALRPRAVRAGARRKVLRETVRWTITMRSLSSAAGPC